jgi:hypothetical protein
MSIEKPPDIAYLSSSPHQISNRSANSSRSR